MNRESAYEILTRRLERTEPPAPPAGGPFREPAPPARAGKGWAQVAGGALLGALTGTVARTVGRELVRGVFGLLRSKQPRTTRRSRW